MNRKPVRLLLAQAFHAADCLKCSCTLAPHLSRLANPAFIPLGGEPSIYAAWRGPSIYAAWRGPRFYPAWRAQYTPLGEPSTRRLAVSMKNPFPLPVKGLFCQVVTAVAVLPRYPSPMRQVVVLAAAGQQGLLYSHCVHQMPPLP